MSAKQRRSAAKKPQPAASPAANDLPFRMFEEAVRYHQAGQIIQAEALYRAVLTIHPSHAAGWYNLGVLLHGQGRPDRAVPVYREALALQPGDVNVLTNLATALKDMGQLEQAIATYRQALAIKPEDGLALSNLGVALKDQGNFEEALAVLQQAVNLKPDDARALSNLGALMFEQGDYDSALSAYGRSLAIDPSFGIARVNLGSALRNQGRIEDAMVEYQRAIASQPDFAEAHYCLGQLLLLQGDFQKGWPEYGWRWKLKEYSWLRNLHGDIQQPLWSGESLQGKTILIYAEQGLGDTIQVVRYVPHVLERGAKVVLAVHDPLKNLFRSVEGVTLIGLADPLPPFDYHCPLLNLPRVFGTRLDSIPAAVPYLGVQASKREEWRAKLAGKPGFKVGLVWSGNRAHTNDRNRSLALEKLAPLFDTDEVSFYSLQKDVRPADQMALSALGGKLVDLSPQLVDLCDTAAAIGELDLVISVDTAVAHLAGALARPVWLLLPFVPDWRWLRDRADTPWYPSARLFRQTTLDSWPDLVARVAAGLQSVVRGAAKPTTVPAE